MRRHMGIGVVVAVLLFGLIAPGVAGASGSDRLVAAGPAHGVDHLVKAFRTITEALRRSPSSGVRSRLPTGSTRSSRGSSGRPGASWSWTRSTGGC